MLDAHSVPFAMRSSVHTVDTPSQKSSASQPPVAERQLVPAIANVSGGHTPLEHVSSTSQTDTAGRHEVPLSRCTSAGHDSLEPVHISAGEHTVDPRHSKLDVRNRHVDWSQQSSAESHSSSPFTVPSPHEPMHSCAGHADAEPSQNESAQ